jgi:hypothetical protein
MKGKLFIIILVIKLIIISEKASAQTSLCLYPFNNALGVSFGKSDKLNLEVRTTIFYSNADGNSFGLEPEIITTFRISGNEIYRLFAGIGIGYGYNYPGAGYGSVILPLGFNIKPVEKLPAFVIHTELSPVLKFYDGYNTLKLQPRLGLCIGLN